jgi:hypothetical protein
MKQNLIIIAFSLFISFSASAQFIDNFNDDALSYDSTALNGWTFYTGDGSAVMNFSESGKGYATINVDATHDTLGIWWALIRHRISKNMDLSLIRKPNYEFRVEAKIRVSSAPKRVNLHLNTERTTNFHTNLKEYDIDDTTNWHVISMTTKNFDAVPGDTVYGQLAMMDWGLKKYRVDIDYYKVDIVNIDSVGPDEGNPLTYRPPIPGIKTFSYYVPVLQDAVVDLAFPGLNFNNWSEYDKSGKIILLTASGSQYIIMRWDLSKYKGMKVKGSGLLELTTYSLERSPEYQKDFGNVRVTEILGGDPEWNQKDVTFNSFCRGQEIDNVINSQMTIDIIVDSLKGGKNYITISNPVLQRMMDGKTLGIAIKPLGAVDASFYAMENEGGKYSAKLHFNLLSGSK